MKKRFAGILLLMLVLVACGDKGTTNLTSIATEDVNLIGDIKTLATPSSTRALLATFEPGNVLAEDITSVEDIKSLPTPRSTKDPLVTYTVTPIPTQVPSFSNVRLTHDLVWLDRSGIQRGHLMRWDATQNEIQILAGESEDSLISLPGKVTDFDLKANIVLVSLQVGDDSGQYFELGSIDLETGEYFALLNTAKSLSAFSQINEVKLSPNGRWAAYVLSESQVGTTNTSELNHGLYILRISDTSVPVLFASCEKGGSETTCIEALIWSPDNSMLAWHGPGGTWLGILEEGSRLELPDFFGEDQSYDLRYWPSAWSLNSKYLEVQVWGQEGGYKGVYDLSSGRFIVIPETYLYAGTPYSETTWLPNGQLLVIESGYQVTDRKVPSKIFAYSINTDLEDGWLFLSDIYEIEAEFGDMLFQAGQNDSQVLEFLRARIDLGNSLSNSTILQLISLDRGSGDVTELNQTIVDFPEGFENIYGRLVGSQHNASYVFTINYAVIYLSTDGLYATPIQDLFGSEACCFAWVNN